MSDKKLLLKEIFKKNSHKEELRLGASEFFSKTGRLFALTGRRGELNQDGEISPSDGERMQVCKIVQCDVFSPSQKLFTAIKKECVISF